jgi:diguanylate cyclase (GGDEF)-like protein
MSELAPAKDRLDGRGIIVTLILGILTAFVFRIQFHVQSEYSLAFIFAFPVAFLAVSNGFRLGALAAIVSASVYGSLLVIYQLVGRPIGTTKLNAEIINLGIIVGSGFVLGLITEYLTYKEAYREEATIVETFVPDDETGFYNFKSFRWMLRGEMSRVKRYSRPLSIVFIRLSNLDLFQSKHDYQHELKLFKLIGQFLQGMLRDADFVGKHSDNEVGIVLPETPVSGADIVCKRLVEQYASLQEDLNENWPDIEMEFHFSRASFPKDAGNLEELVDVLDGRYKKLQ